MTDATTAFRLRRAAGILASITGASEARRDAAFACLAELLRAHLPELAYALAAELRGRVPHDPEAAAMPPDPPPGIAPATRDAFAIVPSGAAWPWKGTTWARRQVVAPAWCAGLGAHLREGGESDGWAWAEAGAATAGTFLTVSRARPPCEALGTFLAWLVMGRGHGLARLDSTAAPHRALRPAWPEARRLCRPGPDGTSPEDARRQAAAALHESMATAQHLAAALAAMPPPASVMPGKPG